MQFELSGIYNYKKINLDKINKIQRKKIIINVFSKKSSTMLGWLDLVDLSEEDICKIEDFAFETRKKFKNFVVLGIGGSALGTKMIKHAFFDSINKNDKIKSFVCDNIDSDYFLSLLKSLNLKKTIFNVITKSGTTSETLAQLSIVIDFLKKKNISLSKNIFVTTTRDNELYKFAISNHIKVFEIPESVGGRFSVLSNVGLVPASIMGLNIRDLLKGAEKVKENSQLLDLTNIAYTTAYINFKGLQNNLTNLVIMPYSDRLALVSDYFAQLWAESLGKKYDLNGKEVFTGQNPIKAVGVTDQHSQLQLFTEGPNDKLFMFIKVKENLYDFQLNENIRFAPYLKDISLSKLLEYEFLSTQFSLTCLNKLNYGIYLDKINEESIGELIFYLQMTTAFMGELLNVNTYDQNGVETSKKFTKACLNVVGLKKEGKLIKEFINNRRFIKL